MATLVRKKDHVKGTGPSAGKGDTVSIDIEGYLPEEKRFFLSRNSLSF